MNVNDSIMRTTFLKVQSNSTHIEDSYGEGVISYVGVKCKGKGRELKQKILRSDGKNTQKTVQKRSSRPR